MAVTLIQPLNHPHGNNHLLTNDGSDVARNDFLGNVITALGVTPVACWLPKSTDTTTSVCPYSGRVWTAEATMAGQITARGSGWARAFDGSSNYLSTPDTDNMSFGNGTTDSAFSIFTVVNVTDTAAARDIITKTNTVLPAREWSYTVTTGDAIQMAITDDSVPATCSSTSNAGIIQGAWAVLSSTYSAATGGGTAGNDISHYNNGSVIATTASNSGTYVAMENKATNVYISNRNAGAGTFFFSGSIACIVVAQTNAVAAVHAAFNTAAKSFFGI